MSTPLLRRPRLALLAALAPAIFVVHFLEEGHQSVASRVRRMTPIAPRTTPAPRAGPLIRVIRDAKPFTNSAVALTPFRPIPPKRHPKCHGRMPSAAK